MTLLEKEIKNIYLWEYIPPTPTVIEYSYDFRNKSWTTVQNDWWVLKQWTSWTTINSNWIVMPTRWQWESNNVKIYKSYDFSWATKIILETQYYWEASSRWNWYNYWIRKASDDNTWQSLISWWTTTASWYISRWQWWVNGNMLIYSDLSPTTWTWTSHLELDLVNKTMSFYRNWLSTLNWTLTDAQIEAIRTTWDSIFVRWWHDIWTLYCQTVYMKLEYL